MSIQIFYPATKAMDLIRKNAAFPVPEAVKRVFGDMVIPKGPDDRPYIFGCMVLSLDGKLAFTDDPEGTQISKENNLDRTGADADFFALLVTRTYADGVILGANSLKVRNHKLWYAEVKDPELAEARLNVLGKKTPHPYSIIATYDGQDVPLDNMILTMQPPPGIITSLAGAKYLSDKLPASSRIITNPSELTADLTTVQEEILIFAAGEQEPDTSALMGMLKTSGINHLSVEAPGYIWRLVEEKLLDEFFLNYSGLYAGGGFSLGATKPFGAKSHPHVRLLMAGFSEGFIFTRQQLVY